MSKRYKKMMSLPDFPGQLFHLFGWPPTGMWPGVENTEGFFGEKNGKTHGNTEDLGENQSSDQLRNSQAT